MDRKEWKIEGREGIDCKRLKRSEDVREEMELMGTKENEKM